MTTRAPKVEPKTEPAALADVLDHFVENVGMPTVAVVACIREGTFDYELTVDSERADVYQMIGLLEQLKTELLASVPENRPLREPAPGPSDTLSDALPNDPTESKPN